MPDSQQSILNDSFYAFPSECHTVLEVTLRHVGMERMISLKENQSEQLRRHDSAKHLIVNLRGLLSIIEHMSPPPF